MGLKEFKAANVNDLKDGEMKAVSIGGGKDILLTRIDANYYTIGAHCTHYGGPLVEGVLNKGIVMCPWHHACFDAKTGDLYNPPARDSRRAVVRAVRRGITPLPRRSSQWSPILPLWRRASGVRPRR